MFTYEYFDRNQKKPMIELSRYEQNRVQDMNRNERIRKAIDICGGYDKTVEKTGISKSTLQRYVKGAEPSLEAIEKLAKASCQSKTYLAYGDIEDIDKEREIIERYQGLTDSDKEAVESIIDALAIKQELKERLSK